jgi:hypothetical protein
MHYVTQSLRGGGRMSYQLHSNYATPHLELSFFYPLFNLHVQNGCHTAGAEDRYYREEHFLSSRRKHYVSESYKTQLRHIPKHCHLAVKKSREPGRPKGLKFVGLLQCGTRSMSTFRGLNLCNTPPPPRWTSNQIYHTGNSERINFPVAAHIRQVEVCSPATQIYNSQVTQWPVDLQEILVSRTGRKTKLTWRLVQNTHVPVFALLRSSGKPDIIKHTVVGPMAKHAGRF